MKLTYQFTFDGNRTITKTFEDSVDYIEFLRVNGHNISDMCRINLIDEQTQYNGNLLNESSGTK